MGYPVQLREIRRTPNALTIFSMLTWCYRVAVILPACHAGDPSSTLGSTAKTIVIDKVTSYISVRIRFFPPIWENGVMVNATVLKTVYKTKLYLSVLCLYLIGAVVQLVRMPPCHGGDSRVRVPSAPQIHSQIDTYFVLCCGYKKKFSIS